MKMLEETTCICKEPNYLSNKLSKKLGCKDCDGHNYSCPNYEAHNYEDIEDTFDNPLEEELYLQENRYTVEEI